MLIVAEIGSMHKGDLSLAFELIRQAAQSGADIAKFQLGWPKEDKLRCVDHHALDLAAFCEMWNVEFMASIWSIEGLEAARSAGMKRYKIAAQKADDHDLREAILEDGKQTFISGSYRGENLFPLWCISEYPVYPERLFIPSLGRGNEYLGYSDHTHGIGACLLAVARGAEYIEKHFCIDKTDLSVRDTSFSATPEEMRRLVLLSQEIEKLR